jgi:hypothetical protein
MDAGGGGGATAIRVPYRHLRDAEMELVSLNSNSNSNSSPRARVSPKDQRQRPQDGGDEAGSRTGGAPKYRVVLACMVAAGVQFGWALQLSLLTPYIQVPTHLRAPHALPGSRRSTRPEWQRAPYLSRSLARSLLGVLRVHI